MNAMKMAFFIFACVIAAGIVNGSGIFETQIETPTVNTPGADLAEGITEIDSGSSSLDDIESAYNGGVMVKNIISSLIQFLEVLVVPYSWLVAIGVPALIASGIQAMVTLSEVWGLLQFFGNRSGKGMD